VTSLRRRYGGDRIGLLVNRSDKTSEISIEDIEKAANAKVRHVLPSDYKAALAAMNKGEPIARSTQGRLALALQGLARTLMGQEKKKSDADAGGMFGWLTPRKQSRVTG
jgi:pilus assembly protein CpaE